jgi:hypothetical protein
MYWFLLFLLLAGLGWYLWSKWKPADESAVDVSLYLPPRGSRPRRPDSDYDEPIDIPDWNSGDTFAESNPRPIQAHLKISYRDAEGRKTEREVDVRECDTSDHEGYLLGHCHLRNDYRTFRIDRIVKAIDLDTGEIVTDIPRFAAERFKASAAYAIALLLDKAGDALRALFFLGKADGRFTKKEKALFLDYCHRTSGDTRISIAQIEDACQYLPFPSMQAYKLICGRLAKLPIESRRAILETAEAMVATEKTIAAAEAEALEYMRKRLAIQPCEN